MYINLEETDDLSLGEIVTDFHRDRKINYDFRRMIQQ
jgi:hypothetical protein